MKQTTIDPYAPPSAKLRAKRMPLERLGHVARRAAMIHVLAALALTFTLNWLVPFIIIEVVSLAALGVTIVAFLVWTYRVAKRARARGVKLIASPAWCVGWYFVPIANLFMPYQVLKPVLRGLSKDRLLPHKLDHWWYAFVFSRLGMYLFLPAMWLPDLAQAFRFFLSPIVSLVVASLAAHYMGVVMRWTEENLRAASTLAMTERSRLR